MTILMNAIAILLILALLGLIASLAMIVLVLKRYVATSKKAVAIVEPTKNATIELANGIRGRLLIMANRLSASARHIQSAAAAVQECASVVGTLASETAGQAARARAEAEAVAEHFGEAGGAVKFFAQVASVLQQAKH